MGYLLQTKNRIAALLSYSVFIAAEPQTERSKKAAESIYEIFYGNIKKDGNNITISISPDALSSKKNNKIENDFSSIELLFSVLGAVDNSSGLDSIAKTAVDKFNLKLQMFINSLAENHSKGKGFYWDSYVPLFIELKDKSYTDVLSNLIYLSKDSSAQLWLDRNKEKVDAFYNWIKNRKW